MKDFNIAGPVKRALRKKKPVVALESSLLCQGMPYPQNVDTVVTVENIIRECGCEPAIIAVKKGVVHIGLQTDEIENFGKQGKSILKVSTRDLSYVLSQKQDGATTVASTMYLAHVAGIRVFATGGIGGVHRNLLDTFDVSADLIEFSRVPMLVVSAGAKAILDLGKTLEYLETLSIPVVGYRTKEFPAFYSRTSGHPLTLSLNSPEDIAHLYHTHLRLGRTQGILVANPIPEEHELSKDKIDSYLEQAFLEMNQKGVFGKEVTPYLLHRVAELSKGASLTANIRLVENNARLACEIATAL